MKLIYKCFIFFFITFPVFAQQSKDVYVDKEGVMRWPNNEEVKGFGVNYTGPFAHAYRIALTLGVDLKEEIDKDIYHFSRLGFDAYRVHVWDTEISDTLGNLLENEHLELFDYMVAELQKREIKCFITPIAFWGNGWPEKDTYSPGFSHKYGKDNCLTNPEAIKAQANYLAQFLNHTNKYTGVKYKDDPNVVAFEVSNEPHHNGTPLQVKEYISTMVEAMKNTGCQKPIFYNVSHSIDLVDAYYETGIDGGTFQWYPTNLVSEEELGGNLLPNVDRYEIPFAENKAFKNKAKIVYEFDAADMHKAYMYPAMARSFRTAGIQWATHFAYDPTFLADKNTEYNTHFMNLAYTPHKALSLKICSEIFHEMPMYKSYGTFPENTTFGNVSISYENDLVEYVSDEKFFYTNNTSTSPSKINKLSEIAGVGSSEIIQYEGNGAYFLDRLEKGVWRLEVMPDVIITKNPYGKNSLKKKNAEIIWNAWPISIALPQLGEEYSIEAINKGNNLKSTAKGTAFNVSPGTYIIAKKNKKHQWNKESKWKSIVLGEFVAPKSTLTNTSLVHQPKLNVIEGDSLKVTAELSQKVLPQSILLVGENNYNPIRLEMKRKEAYTYEVTIPKEVLKRGYFNYRIVVGNNNTIVTFPGMIDGNPQDWDFTSDQMYFQKVVQAYSNITLFEAKIDFKQLNKAWNSGVFLAPDKITGNDALIFSMDSVPTDQGNTAPAYAVRTYFGDKISIHNNNLSQYSILKLKATALIDTPQEIEVALIANDGNAYGTIVKLTKDKKSYQIKIADLKPTKIVTLPRPYPEFLPYYFESTTTNSFDWNKIESLQIKTIGKQCQISIENIQLITSKERTASL